MARKPMTDTQRAAKRVRDRARRARAKHEREYKARERAIYALWRAAEAEGLVQWACEPETDPLDMFEPDFSGEVDPDAARAEWLHIVQRDGIWMYAAQYRLRETDRWETADSIGGVEGDIKGTGYDLDLMNAALDAIEAARQSEADTLVARGTYAMVAS